MKKKSEVQIYELEKQLATQVARLKQMEGELEIQAALEKVRSRSLKMHKSDELSEIVTIIFEEIKPFGFATAGVELILMDEENDHLQFWESSATQNKIKDCFRIPRSIHPFFQKQWNAWKSQVPRLTISLEGEEKKEFDQLIFSKTDFKYLPVDVKEFILNHGNVDVFSLVTMKHGILEAVDKSPISEEMFTILERFAAVFEQAYTRFLDLKKAEAQAREAQIETALERVRTASMAMNNSEEIFQVSQTLREQLKLLGTEDIESVVIVNYDTQINLFIANYVYRDPDDQEGPLRMGQGIYQWESTERGRLDKQKYLSDETDYTIVANYDILLEWYRYMEEVTPDTVDYNERGELKVPDYLYYNSSKFMGGTLLLITSEEASQHSKYLLKRMAAVFEQAYTRFLDLQKAEAQAREAQIEVALERVRSASMAMHKSDDLIDVANVLYREFRDLGFDKISQCGFVIVDEEKEQQHVWGSSVADNKLMQYFVLPLFGDKIFQDRYEAWKKGEPFYSQILDPEELKHHLEVAMPEDKVSDREKEGKLDMPETTHFYFGNFSSGYLQIISAVPWGEEATIVLTRFSKVFDQTYTRFLDLQKAEAQAREAQIEAALERVRAKAMAMHNSDELHNVSVELFNQISQLGVRLKFLNLFVLEGAIGDWKFWAVSDGGVYPHLVHVPFKPISIFKEHLKVRTNKLKLWTKSFSKRQKDATVSHISKYQSPSQERLKEILSFPGVSFNNAYSKRSGLSVGVYDRIEYTTEEILVVQRFGTVFEQAYTRFLDLQKVQAQAREAKIEAALERVRARAMAMHHSEELHETNAVIIQQVRTLDIPLYAMGIHVCHPDKPMSDGWLGDPVEGQLPKTIFHHVGDRLLERMYDYWKSGETFVVETMEGQDLMDHFQHVNIRIKGQKTFDPSKMPTKLYYHLVYFELGFLVFVSFELIEKDQHVFKKVAQAFGQAYTRFQDLQKAEGQAKEAQIETALEKVRSATMAMHKSEELSRVASVMFKEFYKLNLTNKFTRVNICINDENNGDCSMWLTKLGGDEINTHFHFNYFDNEQWKAEYLAYKKLEKSKRKEHKYTIIHEGQAWDELISFGVEKKIITPEELKIFEEEGVDKWIEHLVWFAYGSLVISGVSPLSDDGFNILQRFAAVFEQTYTRFLDLEKAEAQAREAQIEAAMERIRSRAIAMRSSEELLEVALEIRVQTDFLGQQDLEASVVHLYEKDASYFESMAAMRTSGEKGDITTHRIKFPVDATNEIELMMENYWSGLSQYTIELNEKMSEEWETVLQEYVPDLHSQRLKFDDHVKAIDQKEYWNFADFSGGSLLTVTYSPPTPETKELLKRSADVFDLAYRRYLDLQKAEAQAREAQIETALEKVRSRSMAMHQSSEMLDVADVLFQQLRSLGGDLWGCGVVICEPDVDDDEVWFANENGVLPAVAVPHTKDSTHKNMYEGWKNKQELFSEFKEGKELEKHYEYMLSVPTVRPLFESILSSGLSFPTWQKWHAAYFSKGYLLIITTEHYEDEKIFSRFAKVFDQAYTRFLDLQKAEAQAREAKIEAALERVRSTGMAMHFTEELQTVIDVVCQQLHQLEIRIDTASIFILDENVKDHNYWGSTISNEMIYGERGHIPFIDTPIHTRLLEAISNGEGFISDTFSYEEKNVYMKHAFNQEYLSVVSEDFKQRVYKSLGFARSVAIFKHTGIGIFNFKGHEYSVWENDTLKRFGKVFEQTYTRFLDLQKAEAQARDAQIEAALERVRSASMAMHSVSEFNKVCLTLYDQIVALGMLDEYSIVEILIQNEGSDTFTAYQTQDINTDSNWITLIDPNDLTEFKQAYNTWKNIPVKERKNHTSIVEYHNDRYEELMKWSREKRARNNEDIEAFEAMRMDYDTKGYYVHIASFAQGSINIGSFVNIDVSYLSILSRFAATFEQTYTRFLDLQKAEAQARESQIEAALERVRSKSMAMHHSEELKEVIGEVFTQIESLNIIMDACVLVLNIDGSKDSNIWVTSPEQEYPAMALLHYHDTPIHNFLNNAKRQPGKLITELFAKEENRSFYNHTFETSEIGRMINAKRRKAVLNASSNIVNCIILKHSGLYLSNFRDYNYTQKENATFVRFAQVIEQSYTRFLDLQKAEAQAREAQIEAALERVRYQAMAMRKSEDLIECTKVVFEELEKLDLTIQRSGIGIFDPETKDCSLWTTVMNSGGEKELATGITSLTIHPMLIATFDAWLVQETVSYVLEGQDLVDYYKIISDGNFYLSDEVISTSSSLPKEYYFYTPFVAGGLYLFSDTEPLHSDKMILSRFAEVFHMTYTRFLDLQKAEAQTREAQIEAALERVRSASMAMHQTSELFDVVMVLFEQLKSLGVDFVHSWISIFYLDQGYLEMWISPMEGFTNLPHYSKLSSAPFENTIIKAWRESEKFSRISLDTKESIEALMKTMDQLAGKNHYTEFQNVMQFEYFEFMDVFHEYGTVSISSNTKIGDSDKNILTRFSKVFEQTYTRFLDLQKAEAQAKEAIRQSSLDRVRGEIASMRSTDDLNRITPLVWKELIAMEVPFIRCGVFIVDEANNTIQAFLSASDGRSLGAMNLPADTNDWIIQITEHWRRQEIYTTHWDRDQFVQNMQSLIELGQIQEATNYQGSAKPPESLHLHFINFRQGMLYVGNVEPLSEDSMESAQSLASSFAIAFARYEDFEKLEKAKASIESTLKELKATQSQLIQSEKMASLGELTAGIAHEIKNPLNFVNNFADISNELIEEMKEELLEGNTEEAIEIAGDVMKNLEKILHHGQRADSIVKGMLEHSRSSEGQKQATDINELADEYLRLAYHGLRAKDNTFNATMDTDYDPSIPMVEIVPQDIGRVLLNLITNAFYAVDEKKKKNDNGYAPTVSIQTKCNDEDVEIHVSDNGDGIPEGMKDKIFQPFFTTKPTGQGTGLGLSLSYDIVKAHNGELSVESVVGEGATFIMRLPKTEG